MRLVIALVLCGVVSSTAFAAPTKNEATAFVKDLEAAVRGNQKVLKDGSAKAFQAQDQSYKSLLQRSKALFADVDACSFATTSAAVMWSALEQQAKKPDPAGAKLNKRRYEEYQESMKFCKTNINKLK